MTIKDQLTAYALNPEVVLEPKMHLYYTNTGKLINLPSVTELINNEFGWDRYDDVPIDYLKMAIKRGNCVHGQIEQYIKNSLEPRCWCNNGLSVKSHEQIVNWCIKLVDSYIADGWTLFSELAFANDECVGSIDIVAVKDYGEDTSVVIIDVKTSKEPHPAPERVQCWKYRGLLDWFLVQNPYVTYQFEIWNGRLKKCYRPDPEGMQPAWHNFLKWKK